MKYLNEIRQQIRLSLLEDYDVTNVGTVAGEEIDYDPATIDALIKQIEDRKKREMDRLSSMKKTYGIPAHPDDAINRQIKRTEKSKMDDIETSIEDADEEAEELEKTGETMQKMDDLNKQYSQTISQLQGDAESTDSSITNT